MIAFLQIALPLAGGDFHRALARPAPCSHQLITVDMFNRAEGSDGVPAPLLLPGRDGGVVDRQHDQESTLTFSATDKPKLRETTWKDAPNETTLLSKISDSIFCSSLRLAEISSTSSNLRLIGFPILWITIGRRRYAEFTRVEIEERFDIRHLRRHKLL